MSVRAQLLVGDLAQRGRDVLGDHVALVAEDGRTTSYAELHTRVGDTASVLAAGGVGVGDRVALLSTNCPEFLEVLLAASLLGATVVPMNLRLRPNDMRFQVDDAGVRFAVLQDEFRTVAQDAGILDRPHWNLEELREQARGMSPNEPVRPDDGATLLQLYTSGTTGRPKGCELSQRNWIASMGGLVNHLQLTAADRVFTGLPFFHVAGLDIALSTLLAGGTFVIGAVSPAAQTWDLVAEHGVTVAQILSSYGAFLDAAPSGLGPLRGIYGQPVPPATEPDLPTGFELWSGYGSTELCGFAVGADRAAIVTQPGTMGRLLLGYTGIVADEQDRPVAPGEAGQLLVRGTPVTSGYWNLPEATEEALAGGWFHTGDLVRQDPETGLLFFLDRLKDMVKPGGENVYCVEVEAALVAHPGVADCAVIGVPDSRWGEAVKAVVVAQTDLTAEDLDAWCLERLAGFKRPRWYEFAQDLPRNALSKVLKPELRAAHDPAKSIRLAERS